MRNRSETKKPRLTERVLILLVSIVCGLNISARAAKKPAWAPKDRSG